MKRHEDEKLEFKREFAENIRKAVIAFANTDGGNILVGVDDDGSVCGVETPDSVRVRIGNLIRDSVRPDIRAFVSVEALEMDGKTVLRIEVQRGTARPYYWKAKGLRPEGVFIRQDAASVPASESAIRDLLRTSSDGAFESMRSLRQDISFREAEAFFAERDVAFGSAQKRSLGLFGGDGLYTNLALMLSDQCPFTIRLAVFDGAAKTTFRERRETAGSVLAQIREAYEYLDRWNRTHAETCGLDRIDRRDYPPEAVREALLNVVMHRDYSMPGSASISLFDDRMEILGPGGLVDGVSMPDVLLGLSALRNKALAAVLYRLRLVEAYGTGLPKIRESYAGDAQKPIFEATDHAFKATLWNRNYAHGRPVPVSVPHDNREKTVMEELVNRGKLSRTDVESLCGVSPATAARILSRLVSSGRAVPSGKGPKTIYLPAAVRG